MLADFGMKTIGKIKRQGSVRKINNVTFGSVNKDFVGKEIEAQFFNIDFFAGTKPGGSFLKFGDPEEVSREVLNLAGFVIFGELLFVVIEAGGETAFGIFVHFVSTNLKFDDSFVFGNDGGMERLVAVLFGHGNIIFDTTTHRHIEGMNDAEGEITISNVVNDNAKGS